jgi:four helix bundle protein
VVVVVVDDVVVVIDGDGDVDASPRPRPRRSLVDRLQQALAPLDTGAMLSFQRLDVYNHAIRFLAAAIEATSRLPRGHSELAKQLRSSAQSTVANIAEGAGRRTRADAGQFYVTARGSAMESAAHFDVMLVMKLVDAERHRKAVELLEGIVAMLTKLAGV